MPSVLRSVKQVINQHRHYVAQEPTVLLHVELVMFSVTRQMVISTATSLVSNRPAAQMVRVTAVMKDISAQATHLETPGAALM